MGRKDMSLKKENRMMGGGERAQIREKGGERTSLDRHDRKCPMSRIFPGGGVPDHIGRLENEEGNENFFSVIF